MERLSTIPSSGTWNNARNLMNQNFEKLELQGKKTDQAVIIANIAKEAVAHLQGFADPESAALELAQYVVRLSTVEGGLTQVNQDLQEVEQDLGNKQDLIQSIVEEIIGNEKFLSIIASQIDINSDTIMSISAKKGVSISVEGKDGISIDENGNIFLESTGASLVGCVPISDAKDYPEFEI